MLNNLISPYLMFNYLHNLYLRKIAFLRRFSILLFFFSILGISFYYNYHKIIFERPQGIHRWRQGDCASLALNYHHNNLKFFQPEVHLLISENNTAPYTSMSEAPVLYYFIGILYKIFGYHEFIYRIVSTLVFIMGIYALFKIFALLINDWVWSLGLSVLFFTSPVLLYYGNSFLTNIPAFSFALMGWMHFFKYYRTKEKKSLLFAGIFFLVGGLLKVTALFSVFTILGLFVVEWILSFRLDNKQYLFQKRLIIIPGILIIIGIVFSYILYAKHYNGIHPNGHFSTWTYPFWKCDSETKSRVIDMVSNYWNKDYFHPSTIHLFMIMLIPLIVFIRKSNRLLLTSLIFLLIGGSLFAILQFNTFEQHDYYTINLFIIPVFISLNFVYVFKNKYPKLFSSFITHFLLGIFVLVNIYYAKNRLMKRYDKNDAEYVLYKDLKTITPFLRENNIQRTDKVLIIPGASPYEPYVCDQQGWVSAGSFKLDSLRIEKKKKNGVKYLFLVGDQTHKKSHLSSYTNKEPHLRYGNIWIYRVDPENDIHNTTKNISAAAESGADI